MVVRPTQLEQFAEIAHAGGAPSAPAREVVGWFGATRWGRRVGDVLKAAIDDLALDVDPPLDGPVPDETILRFRPRLVDRAIVPAAPAVEEPAVDRNAPRFEGFRVGRLKAAKCELVSVKRDDPAMKAASLMTAHGYSQLPVLQKPWDCVGYVSWRTLGEQSVWKKPEFVREFLRADVAVCKEDDNLFDQLQTIIDREFVLVRGRDGRIQGIITTADLSQEFRGLTEPFLLLGEIERHLRDMINARFKPADLRKVCDPADEPERVLSAADLAFGAYVRLLQPEAGYAQLGLPLDRGVFLDRLDSVRRLRNRVMHFDGDGLGAADVELLRQFARIIRASAALF